MLKQIWREAGRSIPILYVDADIDQTRTTNLLKKLRASRYYLTEALVIVCSVENAMPTQVDKIFQQVKRIKEQHKIPVYGFALDRCNPESYYMLSIADEIYSLPTTVFSLKRNHYKLDWEQFYQKYGFEKLTVKSSQNLSGSFLDKYTSPDTQHQRNRKETEISHIMFKDAVQRRISTLQKKYQTQMQIDPSIKKDPNFIVYPKQQVPIPIIGQEAIDAGLIDGFGEYYEVMKEKHPGCYLTPIKILEDPIELRKAVVLVTSPFLLILFFFKVCLKWSFIMYFWVKGKKEKQKKKLQQKMEMLA